MMREYYLYWPDGFDMSTSSSASEQELLSHVVVPVANEEDARTTAHVLAPYSPERTTVLHVVEKGEGVPDKSPVEQSEEIAREAFAVFRETFPDAEEQLAFRRDIVAAILEVAREADATAIVFCPRGGGRLIQFLSGDRSLRLVTEAERPVITLPLEEGG